MKETVVNKTFVKKTVLYLLNMEDNSFVVNGPECYMPIPDGTIGKLTFDNLIVRDSKQIAMVS